MRHAFLREFVQRGRAQLRQRAQSVNPSLVMRNQQVKQLTDNIDALKAQMSWARGMISSLEGKRDKLREGSTESSSQSFAPCPNRECKGFFLVDTQPLPENTNANANANDDAVANDDDSEDEREEKASVSSVVVTSAVVASSECNQCHRRVCRKCHVFCEEEEDERHVCDEAQVASIAAIQCDCKPCPGCRRPTYLVSGCANMFCTQCHISWHWGTGRRIARAHNPHLTAHLAQVHAADVRKNDVFRGLAGQDQMHTLFRSFNVVVRYISSISRYLPESDPFFQDEALLLRMYFGSVAAAMTAHVDVPKPSRNSAWMRRSSSYNRHLNHWADADPTLDYPTWFVPNNAHVPCSTEESLWMSILDMPDNTSKSYERGHWDELRRRAYTKLRHEVYDTFANHAMALVEDLAAADPRFDLNTAATDFFGAEAQNARARTAIHVLAPQLEATVRASLDRVCASLDVINDVHWSARRMLSVDNFRSFFTARQVIDGVKRGECLAGVATPFDWVNVCVL